MTRASPMLRRKGTPKLRREMTEEKSPRLLNPRPSPPSMEMTEKSSPPRVISGGLEKEAVGDNQVRSHPLFTKTNH